MPNVKPTHTYIVHKPCGCPVASIVDSPADPRSTADLVREFIAKRHYVERVPTASASSLAFGCNCPPSGQLALITGQ